MKIGRCGVVEKIPRGTVLVAVKRFARWGLGKLVGPYSDKVYRTPVGKWSPLRKNLQLCKRGWHVTTPGRLDNFRGNAVYIVECRGGVLWSSNKAAVGQLRLVQEVPTPAYAYGPSAQVVRRTLRAYVRKANKAGRMVVARG